MEQQENNTPQEKNFMDELNDSLQKYDKRNKAFISKSGYTDVVNWLIKFMQTDSASRHELGDKKFNAHIITIGNYTPLIIELGKDLMDEIEIKKRLEIIAKQMKIIEKKL